MQLDLNTLTVYGVAAGLSLSISLVMLVFARFQPTTLLIRHWAIAILVLAAGFFISGIGQMLPRWMTVIGSNMVLLAAGPILYAGFLAYLEDHKSTNIDRWGWTVIALTGPAFWYWGLIDPNGNYRSILFSLAIVAINVRTAALLFRTAFRQPGNLPIWALAALFGVLVVWMATRAGMLLSEDPPPASLRGFNPTTWVTVFWYIVLISITSISAMWLEVHRQNTTISSNTLPHNRTLSTAKSYGNKLFMLWSGVILQIIATIGILSITYANFYESEKNHLTQTVKLVNDTFTEYTVQVGNHVDVILCSVRTQYRRDAVMPDLDDLIQTLSVDNSVIKNINLITSTDTTLLSPDQADNKLSLTDQEALAFHQNNPEDVIFVSSTEKDRQTHKVHFHLSRRINQLDGSFGGLIKVTLNLDAFMRHYLESAISKQILIALIGINDKKLRARLPNPLPEKWTTPVDSPLWNALEQATSGQFVNMSPIDGIKRHYIYQKINNLPLVLITGFSDANLLQNVHARMGSLLIISFTILGFSLILALLLTLEIKRRDEQDRFMMMLSHELKTPISTMSMTLGGNLIPEAIKQRLQRSLNAISSIIGRCLQADRLVHGKVDVDLTHCDIVALAEEIRSTCHAPNRIDIQVINAATIHTDRQLLGVILLNLMDNALKYGVAKGHVDVSINTAAHNKSAGILIKVSNYPGTVGMPDAKRVFSKYYRAPEAYNKAGSGLGLFIASGFAHRLGGQLRYRPTREQVSFELWLPS